MQVIGFITEEIVEVDKLRPHQAAFTLGVMRVHRGFESPNQKNSSAEPDIVVIVVAAFLSFLFTHRPRPIGASSSPSSSSLYYADLQQNWCLISDS